MQGRETKSERKLIEPIVASGRWHRSAFAVLYAVAITFVGCVHQQNVVRHEWFRPAPRHLFDAAALVAAADVVPVAVSKLEEATQRLQASSVLRLPRGGGRELCRATARRECGVRVGAWPLHRLWHGEVLGVCERCLPDRDPHGTGFARHAFDSVAGHCQARKNPCRRVRSGQRGAVGASPPASFLEDREFHLR